MILARYHDVPALIDPAAVQFIRIGFTAVEQTEDPRGVAEAILVSVGNELFALRRLHENETATDALRWAADHLGRKVRL